MKGFTCFLAVISLLLLAGCAENPVVPVVDDECTYKNTEMSIKAVFNFSEKTVTGYNYNSPDANVWIGRETNIQGEYIEVFKARVPGMASSRDNWVCKEAGFSRGDEMKIIVDVDGVHRERNFTLGE